jgi:hypothetical protein
VVAYLLFFLNIEVLQSAGGESAGPFDAHRHPDKTGHF